MSPGGIERSNQEVAKQCRALTSRTEEVYAIQLGMDDRLIPWLVRHAEWLITHFQIKAEVETPYERLRHRAYRGEFVEFAETVHHKDPPRTLARWTTGGMSESGSGRSLTSTAPAQCWGQAIQVILAARGKGAVDAGRVC